MPSSINIFHIIAILCKNRNYRWVMVTYMTILANFEQQICKTMKKFKIEFKWSIIISFIYLAWMTLEKQLGFHDDKLKWQILFNLLIVFPNFVLYYLALIDKKKNYYNGIMNWRQGFISGVVISFIIALLSPIVQFITHEFITPLFFEKMISLSVESKRMTLEQAQNYFNLTAYIWQSISGGLSFGVVIGAIIAYFLKPKELKNTL